MRFFAWPIFRLTLLTFRPQKRDKQVAPSGHFVLLEPFRSFSSNCLGDLYLYLWCEGRFLKVDTPPFVDPPPPLLAPPPPPPNRAFAPPPSAAPISPRCTPPPPPPPPVASYWPSQPLDGRLRAIRPTLVGYVLKFWHFYPYSGLSRPRGQETS